MFKWLKKLFRKKKVYYIGGIAYSEEYFLAHKKELQDKQWELIEYYRRHPELKEPTYTPIMQRIMDEKIYNPPTIDVPQGHFVHRGGSIAGEPVYYIENGFVYRGGSVCGGPVAYIDEYGFVHRGGSIAGEPIYYIENGFVYRGGSVCGGPAYYIENGFVHRGGSIAGEPVYYID